MPDPVELPAFIREAVTCAECREEGEVYATTCPYNRERRDAVRRVLEGLAHEYEQDADRLAAEGRGDADPRYEAKRMRAWAASLEHS
jgi:hypothetical protein